MTTDHLPIRYSWWLCTVGATDFDKTMFSSKKKDSGMRRVFLLSFVFYEVDLYLRTIRSDTAHWLEVAAPVRNNLVACCCQQEQWAIKLCCCYCSTQLSTIIIHPISQSQSDLCSRLHVGLTMTANRIKFLYASKSILFKSIGPVLEE